MDGVPGADEERAAVFVQQFEVVIVGLLVTGECLNLSQEQF